MNIQIKDTYVVLRYSRRNLHIFALHNTENKVRVKVKQNFSIPTQRLYSHIHQSHLHSNHSTLIQHISETPSVFYRHNSTLPYSNQARSPNNIELQDYFISILKTPSKTKDQLKELTSLYLSNFQTNPEFFNGYRLEILQTLLRYKKYDWFREILNSLKPLTNPIDEQILLVCYYAIHNDFKSIQKLIRFWDTTRRELLLSKALPFLIGSVNRPQKALLLWITVTNAEVPDLKLLNLLITQPFITGLKLVLGSLKDINDVMNVALNHLEKSEAKVNLAHYLSYTYLELQLKSQANRVWDATPTRYRNSAHFELALESFLKLGNSDGAYRTFITHKPLQTDETEILMAETLTKIDNETSSKYLEKMVSRGILQKSQVCRILENLLYGKRYETFDKVSTAFTKSGGIQDITFLNLQMSRYSRTGDSKDFVNHLRLVYELNEKPNEKTFEIVFRQFAREGDIKSSSSLLNVLAQTGTFLKAKYFSYFIDACTRSLDPLPLENANKLMKELKIEPDYSFFESLMGLHLAFNQFSRAQDIFFDNITTDPTLKMYSLLLKTYFITNNYLSAHIAFSAIENQGYTKNSYYYLVVLQYYTHQGWFTKALGILDEMGAKDIPIGVSHYHTLMLAYNKYGRYNDTITVFKMIIENDGEMTAGIYREMLVALVKLNIINRGNFDKPIQVVDDLMKANQQKKLNLSGKFSFHMIKPVVNTLIKFYRPDDAYRIMSNFRTINPDYDVDQKLNYIKQELLLSAFSKKWGSFTVVFDKFQEKLQSLLPVNGVAPPNLKKIYNGVIKLIYKYYLHEKKLDVFSKLFHDLIFVHKFTFDSNSMNWVVSRMLMNKSTLHDGLYIIERKLIGGYIAKRLVKMERKAARSQGRDSPRFISKNRFLKPNLALGFIHREVLLKYLYIYIITESKKTDRAIIMKDLFNKYPKVLQNVTEVHERIERRDKFLIRKKSELLIPSSSQDSETTSENQTNDLLEAQPSSFDK